MKRFILLSIVASVLVTGPAIAQMQNDPDAEKIQKLIAKIQKEMREIDQLLLRADQPQEAAKKIDENIKSLQDLLKGTDERQSSVVKGLDSLVKLAKYQKSQRQSSPQSPPEQNKPKEDEQSEPRPKDKEPQDLQKQPGQEQDQPKGGKEDSTEAQQKPANQPPPSGDKTQFKRSDLSDRWGVLPAKEQEDLINALNGRWPERYRRWIDEYFRRVNRAKR